MRAPSWASSSGHLERYEREDAGSWREVGSVVHVNLGRHGLAWGRGLQSLDEVGPAKREGYGRSPAGIFPLDKAFGAADSLPTGAAGFPYLHVTANMYCVEDVHSSHYNEIVDASEVKPSGWQRWSPLRRLDGLFRWGVVVRQNDPDVVVGAGSCVFLHIWRGERRPTAGCTSMSAESLEQILRWLDAKSQPVLVQLPAPVYAAVGARWSLPEDDGESPAEK
ncbi:MAG TPA: L,D-transpeptidase family protein [Polyangiaceae bacterium]|nr:L,D-transpeptidase family protein [Polyangiaceae bacterium]